MTATLAEIRWRPLHRGVGIIGTEGGTIFRVQAQGDEYAAYRIDYIGAPVRLIATGSYYYCKRACEHLAHTRDVAFAAKDRPRED